MAKINLNNITNPQNVSVMNANFQKIVVALDEQVLYRDNPDEEPNQMENDIDMNGKRIYNLPEPVGENEPIRRADAELIVTEFSQPVIDAANAATIAANAATAAAVVATEAAEDATDTAAASLSVANTALTNSNTALAAVDDLEDIVTPIAGNASAAIALATSAQNAVTALAAPTGSSGVGFKQGTGVGSVARTVESKLRDWVSVKDFGAVGDGTTLESNSFAYAHNETPAGRPILVPPGTYQLNFNVTAPGRVWLIQGATFTGVGKLVGSSLEAMNTDGSVQYVGEGGGAKWKFGQNKAGAQGLQIGGGNPQQGGQGMMVYADGYSGWTAMAPSQYPSSAELAVQPSAIAGQGTTLVGTNRFQRAFGGEFVSSLVGKRIYLGIGATYTIASVVNSGEVTVKNLNGSAVSFGASTVLTYVVVPAKGTGICNVNGTTVTRVSGDPFLILGNADDKMRINGVDYNYSSLPSQDSMVLGSSAGVQNNVPYEFWTSVDNLSSALRVHRVSAAGFEENVTLGAYADGYFHLQAAGGLDRQYPFYIGSGYDARGKRQNITMDGTSGSTMIGGGYDWPSAEFEYKNAATNWWYFLAGVPGVGGPSVVARGPDANISLTISPKGSANVSVNGILHQPGPSNTVTETTRFHVPYQGGGSQYGISLRPVLDSATAIGFYNAAGAVIGSVVTTNTATSFNTSSDYRLKEQVAPLSGSLDRVAALKPSSYRWKSDGSVGEGFLAHELQEVLPYAVIGTKDGEEMQAVDYSKVVPLLTSAIQELLERIETLESLRKPD